MPRKPPEIPTPPRRLHLKTEAALTGAGVALRLSIDKVLPPGALGDAIGIPLAAFMKIGQGLPAGGAGRGDPRDHEVADKLHAFLAATGPDQLAAFAAALDGHQQALLFDLLQAAGGGPGPHPWTGPRPGPVPGSPPAAG